MSAILQDLKSVSESSFFITYSYDNRYKIPLHFHPEIEIMYANKGHGVKIIGNSISNYNKGDLVIIGSSVPHVWKSDKKDSDNNNASERIAIMINNSPLLHGMFKLKEFTHIKNLLENSKKGIVFREDENGSIKKNVEKILNNDNIERFTRIISFLSFLSNYNNFNYVLSSNFSEKKTLEKDKRLNKCIEYISENYYEPIKLQTVSDIVGLTPNSFCRFFKKRTQKTFSQYIIDLRLNKACQLLLQTGSNIDSIAYESGFSSVSNFNKQFRKNYKLSPKEYKKTYIMQQDNPLL